VSTTLSERWARHAVAQSQPWQPWFFWACAALSVGLSISFGWRRPLDGGLVLGGMGLMLFLIGFVWWERLGFRRLLEARDAEIKRLRGIVALPAADSGHTP
jgi:hypothetical protein